MGVFDRLLLFIAMLSLGLLSLVTLLIGLGILSLDYLGTSIAYLYGRMDVGLVALVFLLASCRLLIVSVGRRPQVKSIVRQADLGEMRISLVALENLAQRTVREIRGVKETKTKVKPSETGIAVLLHVVIGPENSVPEITQELQGKIRERIQEVTAIEVEDVSVFVDNIGTEGSAKVQ